MRWWTTPSFLALGIALCATPGRSAPVAWTDWTSGAAGSAMGQIVTPDGTVMVEHTGQIAFIQTGTGTNFYSPATPYVSALVDNPPPAAELIALSQVGTRTLTFSAPVEDLFFAIVSLNSNALRFDHDFEIVSTGCGYWGCGGLSRTDLGNGQFRAASTGGEPHGVIRFVGAVSSLTFSNEVNENWHGFTVGTYGIVPEPATGLLTALGVAGLARAARRRRARRRSDRPAGARAESARRSPRSE